MDGFAEARREEKEGLGGRRWCVVVVVVGWGWMTVGGEVSEGDGGFVGRS